MKKSLIVIVLFISYFSFSQEAPEFPKYVAKNSANIFYYNYMRSAKKDKSKG